MSGPGEKVVKDDSSTPREPPIAESVQAHPAWFRLTEQLSWYDSKSQHCQRWFKGLKVAEIALAVSIPTTSLLPAGCAKWVASVAGALIAVLAAVLQMNQYATLWVTYRATAEHLKHERCLFLSGGGPYSGLAEPERLVALAERVEEHVSTEHANWFNETRRVAAAKKPEGL